MAERLRACIPRLDLRVAHGRMRAREIDDTMIGFADGDGDVLLSTSIIESGLDVPGANTMIVMRPALFGLAQLHQLRGRVGRRHLQAFCYLVTEAGEELSEATLTRLGTLQAFDRLGAGMAISAQDLDLRGGGDLFGERQAGHVKLIGVALYQELLAQAIRTARGEEPADRPLEFATDAAGALPIEYIPEAEVRINLYHRLARALDQVDVERLRDEIFDRFGPPPAPVQGLLAAASIRALARSLGVTRIAAGPDGVALGFDPCVDVERDFPETLERLGEAVDWNGERLLWRTPSEAPEERLRVVLDLLEELA